MRDRSQLLVCLCLCLLITSCNKNPMSLIPPNEQYQLMTQRQQPYGNSSMLVHGDPTHQPIEQRLEQLKMQYVEATARQGTNKNLLLQYHPGQQTLDSTQQHQLMAMIKTHQANLLGQVNIIGGPRGNQPGIGAAYQTEKRMQLLAQVFQLNNVATHLYYDPTLPSDTISVILSSDKKTK